MLSVCKSEPIPHTWGASQRGMGQGTAPPTCQASAASCPQAFVHPQSGVIQLELTPREKLLLVPGRQAGSSGRVVVGRKLGAPSGAMLAEQEGDPPKQSPAAQPDTLPPV